MVNATSGRCSRRTRRPRCHEDGIRSDPRRRPTPMKPPSGPLLRWKFRASGAAPRSAHGTVRAAAWSSPSRPRDSGAGARSARSRWGRPPPSPLSRYPSEAGLTRAATASPPRHPRRCRLAGSAPPAFQVR
jgi:hypothetical protein